MKRQQIDLFPPELRQRHSHELTRVAIAFALLVVILASLGAVEEWKNRELKDRQAHLQAEVDRQTRELEAMRKAAEARKADPALASEEKRLKGILHRKRRILDLILDESLGNTRGFSAQLEALARSDDKNLWLEGILLKQGGHAVTLNGSTLAAGKLPDYIQRLGRQPSFAALAFNYLQVERIPREARRHRWTIATERPEKEEKKR